MNAVALIYSMSRTMYLVRHIMYSEVPFKALILKYCFLIFLPLLSFVVIFTNSHYLMRYNNNF
jgi:hypothetical protein